MNLSDLLNTTPETLAQKQHEALKQHVVGKLEVVLKAIRDENYDFIRQLIEYSPAGDGHGCDNHFIDFAVGLEDSLDINEVTERLIQLKQISEPKNKAKK